MPPRVRSPGLKPRPVYTRDTRPADTPMPPTVQRYRTSSSPRISSGSRSRPMTSCATNQMMATRPHNATATSYKAAATVPSHAPHRPSVPPPSPPIERFHPSRGLPHATPRGAPAPAQPPGRHGERREFPLHPPWYEWTHSPTLLIASQPPLGSPTSIPTRAPRTLKCSVIPTSPAAEHVLKVARGAYPCRFRPAWRITLLWRLPLQRPP